MWCPPEPHKRNTTPLVPLLNCRSAMSSFEFIASDSTGKPNSTDLKRVRSRSMKGVHKKPNSRRSLREAKRKQEQARTEPKSVPRPLCSELSTIPLADRVGPGSHRIIHKVLASDLMSQFMAPIDKAVEFPSTRSCEPTEWISRDAPFLYSVLFTGSLMDDFLGLGRQQPGTATYNYLQKTIASLNQKLNEPETHLEDSTMQVIMNLAIATALMGDWDAAWTHSIGLHRFLMLKGMPYLWSNPRLHYHIDRVALTVAMGSGKKILCPFGKAELWKPLYPTGNPSTGFSFDINAVPEIGHRRLIRVFQDLQCLTCEIKERIQNGERSQGTFFQKACNSLQWRLLYLPDRCDDSASELLHVGLYACLSPMFTTPRRNFQYISLANRMKGLRRSIEMAFISDAHADLVLWVLTMSAMSEISTEDSSMREKLAVVIGKLGLGLEDLKSRILRVMWLESFYEEAYRRVYNALERENEGLVMSKRSKPHDLLLLTQ